MGSAYNRGGRGSASMAEKHSNEDSMDAWKTEGRHHSATKHSYFHFSTGFCPHTLTQARNDRLARRNWCVLRW